MENQNREAAFELGAAEAAEYVNNVWKSRFKRSNIGGKDVDYLVRNFNLDKNLYAKAKKGDKEAQDGLWKQFRSRYIVRQAYRGMFQTQFQYSRSARNFMDLDSKTHWLTLFQHYPRSLASTVAWAMSDAKNLYEVGGLKALGRTLSSKSGFAINHRTQHVLTLGMISGLRQLVRVNKGFVLLNVLSHPIGEMLADLVDYFTDDSDMGRERKLESAVSGYDQPIRRITGPMFGELMDVLSLMIVKNGIDDGTLNEWLGSQVGSTAAGLAGFKLNEEALTEYGRREYSNAWDITREHILWDSFAIKDKATNLIGAINSSDWPGFGTAAARSVGIRPDWEVIKDKKNKKKIDRSKEYRGTP
jgi:hypothetical protein